jgi:hypothetical protein
MIGLPRFVGRQQQSQGWQSRCCINGKSSSDHFQKHENGLCNHDPPQFGMWQSWKSRSIWPCQNNIDGYIVRNPIKMGERDEVHQDWSEQEHTSGVGDKVIWATIIIPSVYSRSSPFHSPSHVILFTIIIPPMFIPLIFTLSLTSWAMNFKYQIWNSLSDVDIARVSHDRLFSFVPPFPLPSQFFNIPFPKAANRNPPFLRSSPPTRLLLSTAIPRQFDFSAPLFTIPKIHSPILKFSSKPIPKNRNISDFKQNAPIKTNFFFNNMELNYLHLIFTFCSNESECQTSMKRFWIEFGLFPIETKKFHVCELN